jgi:LmbE family N-acetylglucosaminyl deacetylase
MIPLRLGLPTDRAGRLLAIGAHPDDIEIGAGGTLLRLAAERPGLEIGWAVLSGDGTRSVEARASGVAILGSRVDERIDLAGFRDGFFPADFAAIKEHVLGLRERFDPDVVLVPRSDDPHQDHRLVGELAWQVFRHRLILEYELFKWDRGLEPVNLYVELDRVTCERKVRLLLEHFPSQAKRSWFTADAFWSTLRLRGVESGAGSGLAEGFLARKLVI